MAARQGPGTPEPQGFAAAFSAGDPRAEQFLPATFRRRIGTLRPTTPVAPALLSELADQQRRWGMSPARARMLDKLSHPDARVVVTGQQLGLFLGPLYTVYKALSAVEWASRLEAASGAPVVPVFWLQTEDHDFPEIGTCRTVDGDGLLQTFSVNSPEAPRVSIAHRTCGADVVGALEALRASVASLPNADATFERFAKGFKPGASWVDAFAGTLADCFADEGLLLLNPRTKVFAAAAASIHGRAIEDSATFGRVLEERSVALTAANFRVQVKVRPECSLSFFHPDGASGPRYRLKPGPGGFSLAGREGRVSVEEIADAMRSEPMRFSTSALLRPVVQDTLLPTAAYIAGPGEIGYFAQLKPLYAAFDLQMPMIIPRRHYTLVEPEARRVLSQVNVEPSTLTVDTLDRLARAAMVLDPEALRSSLSAELDGALDRISEQLVALDPGLQRALERTRKTVSFAFGRLAQRVGRAQLRDDQEQNRRLKVLQNFLLPNRSRQERTVGIARYMARFGWEELKRALRNADDPGPGCFTAVEPLPIPTGGRL